MRLVKSRILLYILAMSSICRGKTYVRIFNLRRVASRCGWILLPNQLPVLRNLLPVFPPVRLPVGRPSCRSSASVAVLEGVLFRHTLAGILAGVWNESGVRSGISRGMPRSGPERARGDRSGAPRARKRQRVPMNTARAASGHACDAIPVSNDVDYFDAGACG
jgi:hypothetical protein